jgi:hypothetical protein
MRAWGLVLAAALTGCIIEPPDVEHTPPDAGPGRDGGDGIVIGWDGGFNWDGGGGGGWDGGFNWDGGSGGGRDGGSTPTTSFPGGGLNGDTGTGVLWLVRIDRGTANLAASYATLIRGMSAQLAAEGFDVRVTGVGSLHESRLYWSRSGSDLPAADLQRVLEDAAASTSGAAPTTCSTAALSDMGGRLSSVSVVPPNATTSAGTPYRSSLGALLVVVLDHGERPSAYSGCGTSSMDPAGHFGGSRSPTYWLNSSTRTWNLPRAQTRFLFVATSESESYEQMRARCAAMSNFPRGGLDAISPSSTVFYAPFTIGLENYQSRLGTQEDLCRAVAGDWTGYSRTFAKDWANLLRLPENQR